MILSHLKMAFKVWVLYTLLCAGQTGGFILDSIKPATRPHIVFVLADDLGYNDVGYRDGSEINTPTLDELANEGVKLENYYVQYTCSPTRGQLMTGRYQIHTGLQHGVFTRTQRRGLPLDSPTLADKLKQAGYATHATGKWHLGFYKEEYLPWNRGFDSFLGFLGGGVDYYNYTGTYTDAEGNDHEYLDLWTKDGPVYDATGTYATHLFTDRAIDVINNHQADQQPLFLYLAYNAPHGPLQVPGSYMEQYAHIKDESRRTYAGMVSALDEGVANVTRVLKDQGMWDNTLFIFSTDNGGARGGGASNYPLRGAKLTLWDGGMRGVGFVSGGYLSRRGEESRELMHVSDWFPTLVRLAGGSLNDTKPLDGMDQWDTISKGSPSPRNTILHNIDALARPLGSPIPLYADKFDTSVKAALRAGDWKIITGRAGPSNWILPPGEDRGWESSNENPDKNLWLFNITADPREQHDLSDAMPDQVGLMLDMLKAFHDTAATPLPNNEDFDADPALRGGVWGPWM